MDFVSGKLLTDVGLKSGYIAFNNKKIVEIGKGNPPSKPICKGLITPSFVNAHTHIGDSFIKEKGIDSAYEDVLQDVQARDERDSSRAVAPLKPAEDAHLVDTSDLDIPATLACVHFLIKNRLNP